MYCPALPLVRSKTYFPDSSATSVLLGYIYSRNGEIRRAIKELEAFRRDHDPTPDIYVNLGFWYAAIDDLEKSFEVSIEGAKRFPHSVRILNNLAYFYAMTDRLDEARATLKTIPKDYVPHTELIATKGLLKLREGDERGGRELYEEAERCASEVAGKDLARRVRQKKHLELARYWMRRSAFERARLELRLGLDVKVKYFSYRDELTRLAGELEAASSS